MTAKLIDGSLDVAIALTEGLLAGIAKGHDAYKIIGTYVESPLCKRGKKIIVALACAYTRQCAVLRTSY